MSNSTQPPLLSQPLPNLISQEESDLIESSFGQFLTDNNIPTRPTLTCTNTNDIVTDDPINITQSSTIIFASLVNDEIFIECYERDTIISAFYKSEPQFFWNPITNMSETCCADPNNPIYKLPLTGKWIQIPIFSIMSGEMDTFAEQNVISRLVGKRFGVSERHNVMDSVYTMIPISRTIIQNNDVDEYKKALMATVYTTNIAILGNQQLTYQLSSSGYTAIDGDFMIHYGYNGDSSTKNQKTLIGAYNKMTYELRNVLYDNRGEIRNSGDIYRHVQTFSGIFTETTMSCYVYDMLIVTQNGIYNTFSGMIHGPKHDRLELYGVYKLFDNSIDEIVFRKKARNSEVYDINPVVTINTIVSETSFDADIDYRPNRIKHIREANKKNHQANVDRRRLMRSDAGRVPTGASVSSDSSLNRV